jgi:Mycothiol maleylpyruvate isomerase N-terminal domain
MSVDFGRHCAEIVTQTTLLTGHMDGADLTAPVPTCPGWNVSQLLRHVDGGQRWATEIVATCAIAAPPDVAVRDLSGATDEDPVQLAAVLTEAADRLATTLAERGPTRRCGARLTVAALRSMPGDSPTRRPCSAPMPRWH